ncbi:hypothetical protein CWE09_10315 [Aliidiomarina minuta]|uniref:Uncharacterized protein n=1 Tax=Aliidiomarina minuta TaxID=880057 RepID=A0A432W457_9GAMM|nr:hypothetical protein [Aliidiomarina minuta]RUO24265.1 hypothetical protein CWE09_10315 [Aliidiomarina minuta]
MRSILLITLLVAALFWFAPGIFAASLAGLITVTVSGFVGLLIVGGVMLFVGLIFGSALMAFLAGGITLLFVGFSLLWPLLIAFILIWLCTRGRTQSA